MYSCRSSTYNTYVTHTPITPTHRVVKNQMVDKRANKRDSKRDDRGGMRGGSEEEENMLGRMRTL